MRHRLILLAVGLSVAGVLAVGSSTQAKAGGNGATVVRVTAANAWYLTTRVAGCSRARSSL